jgi:nucleoside-diphosphate-sugar epimerase
MKIFLAGSTGAVGRPLLNRLVASGHDVVGLTRLDKRARWLRENGATAVVGNALDAKWLERAMRDAAPEVVIDQMTDLPQRLGLRRMRRFYRGQNALRTRGSGALLAAARSAGARRMITQSVAFIYAPDGGGLKRETDRVWDDAPEPFGEAIRIAAEHDSRLTAESHPEGVVLRYGVFYGPGTHYAPGNGVYEDIRRRRMPLVGQGDSIWSFCHVDDAAQAAVDALDRGTPGIYNIVDDEPVAMREWLPHFAQVIGAKPPHRVPVWLSRVAAGPAITAWATAFPGASNEKARRELGWEPSYPTWREGFERAWLARGAAADAGART